MLSNLYTFFLRLKDIHSLETIEGYNYSMSIEDTLVSKLRLIIDEAESRIDATKEADDADADPNRRLTRLF